MVEPMEHTPEMQSRMRKFCALINSALVRPLTWEETMWLNETWGEGMGALAAINQVCAKWQALEALDRVKNG